MKVEMIHDRYEHVYVACTSSDKTQEEKAGRMGRKRACNDKAACRLNQLPTILKIDT